MFYLYFIPGVTFSSNFLHAVTFLLLHCIVRMYMMTVLQEIKGLMKELCLYTFQEEVHFPCKISGPLFTWFTCFDISMACIIMYCQDSIFSRSRQKILYGYALDRTEICLHAKCSLELWLVRFKLFSKAAPVPMYVYMYKAEAQGIS